MLLLYSRGRGRKTFHSAVAVNLHSQDEDGGDEHDPVECSPLTVEGVRLLLVHPPTAVTTATATRQYEAQYGHQDHVGQQNPCTNPKAGKMCNNLDGANTTESSELKTFN